MINTKGDFIFVIQGEINVYLNNHDNQIKITQITEG
jgi:hypothetical protein